MKYIKLFEQLGPNLKAEFLSTFPNLVDYYFEPGRFLRWGAATPFAVWQHSDQDKGRVSKLIDLGLIDAERPTEELVRSLPGTDRIVCIYGHRVDLTEREAELVNLMCPSLVTGFHSRTGYDTHLDEDMLMPLRTVAKIPKPNGIDFDIARTSTYNGYPLTIVKAMSWTIWFDVDDLDKLPRPHEVH